LAIAKLTRHPNIVAVLQVGEIASGLPYLVMPCYERRCLRTRIARLGRLPVEEALRKRPAAISAAFR